MAQPYTDLNPNIAGGEVAQNTLNYSRGFEADKGSATLIKAGSEALDMSIKATDQYIKDRSRQELTSAIDAEREKTGQEASLVSTRKDLLNSGVPALVDINGQLEDLARARQQGVMRDSQYWARIELISKQARARYAGYREHIDNTVAQLVGTTPANKLVSTLLDDAQRRETSSLSEEDKFRRTYEKENEQYLPPDYFERQKMGQPYDFSSVRTYVANQKRTKGTLELKGEALRVDNLENDTRNKLTAEKARFDVGTKTSFAMDPILNQIDKLALNAQGEVDRTGGLSPQTEAEVRKTIGQARVNLTRIMDKTLSDPSYLVLSREQRNGIRQEFEDSIGAMETAFLNKDFGLLKARANSIKAFQESDEAVALNNSSLAMLGAVNRIAGPQVASGMLTRLFAEINAPTALDRSKAQIEASRLFIGQSTPEQAATNLLRAGATPKTIASVIKVPLSTILDSRTPPQVTESIIKSYYGTPQQADSLLRNAKTTGDRRAIFNTLVNPEIAAAIKKHSDTTGNPQYFNNYSAWATNAFITNFSTELGSLDNIMSSPDIKVEFKNGQFIASPSDELAKRGVTDPVSRNALVTADRLSGILNGDRLRGINDSIKNMLPVWEATKTDPNKAIGDILLSYRGTTQSSPSGLEPVLNKVSKGYKDTIDLLRTPARLTKEQLGSFFEDIDKIKTDMQNDDTDPMGSLRRIMEMAESLRYSPGLRESTNIEDVTGAGKFAQPNLTR